jgi:hypothetical protein
VFVASRADEATIREKISMALAAGVLHGPDRTSEWTVITQSGSAVTPADRRLRFVAMVESP